MPPPTFAFDWPSDPAIRLTLRPEARRPDRDCLVPVRQVCDDGDFRERLVAIAGLIALGEVPALPRRQESPNQLAWPGVQPYRPTRRAS